MANNGFHTQVQSSFV